MPPDQTAYPSYTDSPNSKRNKLIVGIILAALVLLAGLSLLNRLDQITVEVNVATDSTGEITYQFVDQSDQEKITEIKDTSKTIQARLPRGNYELTVIQEDTSFFTIIPAHKNLAFDAAPEQEKGRRFIGNRPNACIHTVGGILLSYVCEDSLENLQTHKPATADTSSSAEPTFLGGQDIIEGIIRLASGQDLLVLREVVMAGEEDFADNDEVHSPHTGFVLGRTPDNQITLGERVPLPDLSENNMYSFVPHQDGFVAYDTRLTSVLYYDSLAAQPSRLPIADLSEESYFPSAFSSKDGSYVIVYSSEEEDRSKIVVYEGEDQEEYTLDKDVGHIRLCGDKKVCAIHDNTLEVYELNNGSADFLYSVSSVETIENLGNSLLVVRPDSGVLELDVDDRQGFFQVSLDNYSYCGIRPIADSYLLCVMNERGDDSILEINQEQANDGINQLVAGLLQLPEVKLVSVYDTYIFVSPEAGELIYNEASGTFGYDPEALRSANIAIDKAVDDLGIDRAKYHVKSTLGN